MKQIVYVCNYITGDVPLSSPKHPTNQLANQQTNQFNEITFPIHRYEWYRNGLPLEFNGNAQMSDPDGTLAIRAWSSIAEGYFQCIASNTHGRDLSVVTHLERPGECMINYIFLGLTLLTWINFDLIMDK